MKDGIILKTVKFIDRIRYAADLKLTRMIRSASGERPFRLDGACSHCGTCCETPMISVFLPFFFLKSVRWLILTWHRIVNGFEFIAEDRKARCFIFRCTHFDPATKLCDAYDSRPGMCRDYPRNLLDSISPEFLEGCGYRAVLKHSDEMMAALNHSGLPQDKLQELRRNLHLSA